MAERAAGADEDVHMLASLVDHVIERCSAPGDLVFDPFVGFGTTLARAVALGRRALGIELLPERVDLVRALVPSARVIEGDARDMLGVLGVSGELGVVGAVGAAGGVEGVCVPNSAKGWGTAGGPSAAAGGAGVDLILTSPPYMTEHDHEADPLTAYELDTGEYRRYLGELGLVAAQCARLVARGGFVVWNVADIHHRGHTTRLIDDCAAVLSRHLEPVGVTEIAWDQHPHDLVRDALLIYRRV